MSTADLRQIVVFAAIFTVCQIFFDWVRGVPLSAGSLGSILLITVLVTIAYALLTRFLKKRQNSED